MPLPWTTLWDRALTDILKDYFAALDRLKSGKPISVPSGTRITNDSVSLEAGRKKGTIKRSRPIFSELIEAIAEAQVVTLTLEDKTREQLSLAKAEAAKYRILWEEALSREVSLVKELWDSRDAWAKEREAMTSGKVTPINRTRKKS